MTNFTVKKVAVLGAGVMGAQIAAHCVNAKVPVVLFDLPAKEGPKNGIVLRAIENLKKLSPAPLGNKDDASLIEVANYEDNLDVLAGCDLIIEAIAERMDWKHDLYAKVAPHIAPNAIFASNTSGLSINKLAEGFDDRTEGALLRRPLLQPAALHAPGRADPDHVDAAGNPRPARDLPDLGPRQGRRARERHAELHRQPRRHLRHAGHHPRSREIRPVGGRGRRPDRRKAGPRQVGHLPYRRRRRPGHDGPRHQDHAGHPAGRPVLQPVQDAGRAGQADREGRPGPEDRRRLLQESRQGHPAPRLRHRRIRRRRRQGSRHRRAHPERKGSGQEVQGPARIDQPAGAVPVGDLPRRLPLHRRPPRHHRRQRTRHRLRHALGLRLERRPVRDLASRRLEADRRMGQGRHRRRQGADQHPAASLGLRWPGRREGRAHA